MVDPLKPFSAVVRSLWERSARRPARTDGTSGNPIKDVVHVESNEPISTVNSLTSRLRARLGNRQQWNELLAREVFVESILLSEIGSNLASDPLFPEIIKKVSDQLAGDRDLSSRLDALLQEVAASGTNTVR